MFNLILFGPPGAGKGTQSVNVASKYQLKHISTGEILREEVRLNTPIGREVDEYLNNGKLVPDEILIVLIRKFIEENRYQNGFVMDGFPRTLVQAEALDKMFADQGTEVSLVISLEVNEEELVQRLSGRAEEQGRSDDRPAVIRDRLETYRLKTSPLLKYFEKQGKLHAIYGIGSVNEIFDKLCVLIDQHL
jgi:adenylate kinase